MITPQAKENLTAFLTGVDYREEGHDYGFVIECERPPFDDGGCYGCTACA